MSLSPQPIKLIGAASSTICSTATGVTLAPAACRPSAYTSGNTGQSTGRLTCTKYNHRDIRHMLNLDGSIPNPYSRRALQMWLLPPDEIPELMAGRVCRQSRVMSVVATTLFAVFLVGGPVAMADVGDFLLENDEIRVAILGPRHSPGPGVYGGSLVDADLRRPDPRFASASGRDRFAESFPVANLLVPDPGATEVFVDPKSAPIHAQMLVGMVALTGQWWLDRRKFKKEQVAAHLVNLAWNGLAGLEPSPTLVTSRR